MKQIPDEELSKRYDIAIVIDFGTSRSGFAYAWFNSGKPHIYSLWENQPIAYPKTLTSIAYNRDKTPVWGWKASDRFSEDSNTFDPPVLHTKFKMDLHPFKKLNDSGIETIKLVVDSLRIIKETALAFIFDDKGLSRNQRILWRITIPAIFMPTDAKQKMIESALDAGITPDYDQQIIISEPEMAAVYCARTSTQLQPGKTFMVVDAGGGTVDITSYEIQSNKKLKQLSATTSEDTKYKCGSTYVDNNFINYLGTLFSTQVIENFKREQPAPFNQLLRNWEQYKCHNQFTKGSGALHFPFSAEFAEYLNEHAKNAYAELKKRQKGRSGILFDYDTIYKTLFEPVLDKVGLCIEEHYGKFKKIGKTCDYLCLVGGFARSNLLKDFIKQKFGKHSGIIRPESCEQAVLQGAVFYALDPSIIHSRKSDLTYGIDTCYTFAEGIDPEYKKMKTDSGILCKNRFSIFANKDSDVSINSSISQIYTPVDIAQTQMEIKIYTAREPNPRYTDGHQCLGTYSIPLTGSGLDRQVEMTFHFDGQSIRITAEYNGQEMLKESINFEPYYG